MDQLDEMLASFDEFYPGSKMKRRPPRTAEVVPQQEKREPLWDAKPVMKTLHGKSVEMFTIGALAHALGKAEGTIREYQTKGYLPKTPYRLPSRMVNGVERAGRRLFTREMIESAAAAFESRGLLDAKRVEWNDHRDLSREIAESWAKIQADLKA